MNDNNKYYKFYLLKNCTSKIKYKWKNACAALHVFNVGWSTGFGLISVVFRPSVDVRLRDGILANDDAGVGALEA